MLFSNVDDPNYTIESILNYIDYGSEFKGDLSWANFKEVLKEFCSKGSDKKDKSSILIQSWQRFRRLINNSINDDIFVNAKSSKKEQHQVYLSDEIMNINGGEMKVVDIAGLTEQLQCLVFGDIIRSVYSLKHGDFEDERTSKKPIPKRIIIFVDELNKYAPSTSSKNSPLLANLLDITERGRSEGVILFSAEQFRSAIHDRIKGNCGTNIYGRTNAIEVSRPDYKFVPSVYANMMTRLRKGDLIVHHPVFKTLLKIQFPFPSYETYKDDEFVTPLVTQISWTNHLLIMSGSKTAEERYFYMALCAKEHYSKRELERQIGTSYYERSMISAKKPMPESVSHDVRESILDTYVLEFLDLPEQFSEKNLRKAIIENLKQFILEFGRDFTFIGEEYRVQVGNTDFFIDLLFYNRALSCLVPIELKIGKFKPEHIGQINFYLEALDRDVKKPNENPSVGVILCASKDDAVVEYALSRSMSPTLVADYRLCLPDKTLLQNKLRELTELALESGEGNEGDEE